MTIPATFQESHARVCELIADFQARESFYLSAEYQEAEARQDFIDKFWIALGWDVRHDQQKNPYEQEVKVERGVAVGLAQKRADYAFFLGPNFRDPRFFCEAKKPSVDIRTNRDAHFQTHRYGWNSQAKLSVLFDFQELVVIDCRRKPHIDAALAAAHRSYHCRDFEDAEKFGEVYWLFSREAVGTGKLDAYIAALPKPKKTGKQLGLLRAGDARTVDASFLDDLEQYRGDLARMLKNQNPELDGDTLTELVQRILDRLVFLRFLEDKLIETEHRVHDFSRAAAGQSWAKFIAASGKLDARYNGIVFKSHPLLDSGSLKVDDGDFADLCEELSHVRSPYDFNAIPVHILGSIYERFLGTVIVTTDKRAKPEQKPEVRKAGGVYYTPEYIVRYICEQTVGKLIEGKSPAHIEKLRFADIACGSGSFLLGIFDLLLRYHGRWYAEHPEAAQKENLAPATKNKKKRKDFIPAVAEREGLLCLTLEKKRQILLNNVFGVDLDPQAVEVAQLSLYLKLLEDETTASTREDYLAFHEALLPSLDRNIKCGNSLVGTDILFGQFEFTAQEERKLRPMDFESAFPQVFAPRWSGGDRVKDDDAGYHVEVGFELQREVVDDAERKVVKTEKTKPEAGGFDAIVGNPPYRMLQPHNTSLKMLEYLRKHYVAADFKIDLFHLFLQRAIEHAARNGFVSYIVPTTLLNNVYAESLRRHIAGRCALEQICVAREQVFEDADVHTVVLVLRRERSQGTREAQSIATTIDLSERFTAKPTFRVPTRQSAFKDLPGFVWNILVNEDNASLIEKLNRVPKLKSIGTINRGLITGNRDKFFAATKLTADHVPILAGADVHRYWIKAPSEFVLFQRPEGAGGCWLPEVHFAPHKIAVRQIAEWPTAGLLTEPFAVTGNIFTVRCANLDVEKTVLAVINSKVARYYWQTMFADFKTSFPQVTIFSLDQLPIPTLDLTNPAHKAQHDRLVQLVEAMLKAKAEVPKTESERTYLEDKCAGLDRQIDQVVYQLYELTPEEVALVEGH